MAMINDVVFLLSDPNICKINKQDDRETKLVLGLHMNALIWSERNLFFTHTQEERERETTG